MVKSNNLINRKNKTVFLGLAVLLIMAIFTACTEAESQTEEISGIIPLQTYSYTAEDLNSQWSEDETTAQIVLADDDTAITGSGATYENGTLAISSEGTYLISGSLKDGQIKIDAGTEDTVRLILNGVSVTNNDGPALYEKNSNKTVLTLVSGSKNTLRDGKSYSDTSDGSPDAALYATHDLSINGNGELVAAGSYNNAIGSQDNLCIVGSTINATAKNNGIKGRDILAIKGGNITVDSQKDGLKSNNNQNASKGFIQIDDGTINVSAVNDGIQAETNLIINDGKINVTTTGTTDSDGSSAKGLKAASQIAIKGGTLNIDSTDDAIHANGNITVDDGTFSIKTGDDGFHADYATVINDGTINITDCYEGIEGATVEINGGKIDIVSSDDAINAAGGSSDTTTDTTTDAAVDDRENGPRGKDQFGGSESNNEDNHVKITGGEISILAGADGLDSNGALYIEGGKINVSTPSSGVEGTLDANGEILINGGELYASGVTQMAQTPSDESTQKTLVIASTAMMSKGETIYIVDSSGNVVADHTPQNDCQLVLISNPVLEDGKTYSVCSGSKDNVLFDVTLSGTNTIVDETGQETQLTGMGGGQPGGNGGTQPGGNGGNKPERTDGGTPPNGQPPSASQNGTET